MRACDIKINEIYRHKDHPRYAFIKALKVLRPKQDENTLNRIVVKCAFSTDTNFDFALIKYFKPSDLLKYQN